MKELYELLNDVQMDCEKFEDCKLSEIENMRIKKKLKGKLSSVRKGKKMLKTSFAKVCACAALTLCVSGLSVAAATGVLTDAMKTLFQIDTKEKVQVANEMGFSTDDIYAESGDIKVIAESILRDSQHISVIFNIERKDGGMLDESGRKCVDVTFDDAVCLDKAGDISNFSAYGWTMEQEFNAKSIKYCKIFSCEEEMGDTIDVKLSDMFLSFGDLESPQVKIKGTWKFSIPTKYKNCSVDLAKGQKLKLGGTKLTLKKFMISPMGYHFEVNSKEKFNDKKIINQLETDGEINLYLKNGECIPLGGASAPVINEDGTWSFYITGTFDRLILLDEMDKVTVGHYEYKV